MPLLSLARKPVSTDHVLYCHMLIVFAYPDEQPSAQRSKSLSPTLQTLLHYATLNPLWDPLWDPLWETEAEDHVPFSYFEWQRR